ncbi:MAG: methyl-accepting chemotaxis protein [Candidatus Omnitrophota bacterium]|jgi:methyl-accepting chemotaxis protein
MFKKRFFPFRAKLLLAFLALTAFPLLFVGFFSYRSASRALIQQAAIQNERLVEKSVEQIDSLFTLYLRDMSEIIHSGSVAFMTYGSGRNPEGVVNEQKRYISSREYIAQIRFLDMNGTQFIDTADQTAAPKTEGAGKLWFEQAKRGNMFISDVSLSENLKIPTLTIASPVMNEAGIVQGVAAVDIKASSIFKALRFRDGADGSHSFAVNKEGKIIFHTQGNMILKDGIGAVSNDSFKQVIAKMIKSRQSDFTVYNEDGVVYYVFYTPYTLRGWSMGLSVPQAAFLTEPRKLLLAVLGITAIVVIITTVIAFWFSRQVTDPLRQFITMLRNLVKSEGDLTHKINITSSDELGILADLFNQYLDALHTMITEVRMVSDKAANSSEEMSATSQEMNVTAQEISKAIQQVSGGAVIQSRYIDDIFKVMEKLALSLKQVIDNAQTASLAVSQTTAQAEDAYLSAEGAVKKISFLTVSVQDTTKVIQGLGQMSQQIGEITGTITTIADQTNLLALNAAIEAARAGEAGRGFAVVAEEVRKLAEASSAAVRKIGGIIKSIQAESNKAVDAIQVNAREVQEGKAQIVNVTKVLHDINQVVQQATLLVNQIALSGKERVDEIERVVKSINEVSIIARESAATSQQVSSATEEQTASMQELSSSSQELLRYASELKQMVDKFKV